MENHKQDRNSLALNQIQGRNKVYRRVDVQIRVHLTVALIVEVSGQIHTPAVLHLGKESPVPIR
jgi:hypothetical protein